MIQKLSAKRPYLLRAYYDWISDNDLTPFLVVNTTYYGVDVPEEYIQDNQIILNISMRATNDLILNDEAIEFNARFQGVTRHIRVPIGAVTAIYARENGDGAMFEPEEIYIDLDAKSEKQAKSFAETEQSKKAKENNFLRIIK